MLDVTDLRRVAGYVGHHVGLLAPRRAVQRGRRRAALLHTGVSQHTHTGGVIRAGCV